MPQWKYNNKDKGKTQLRMKHNYKNINQLLKQNLPLTNKSIKLKKNKLQNEILQNSEE